MGGDGFAGDASLIAADANKQRSGEDRARRIGRSRRDHAASVEEYLETLDDAAFGAASETVAPKFVSPVRSGGAVDGRREGDTAFFAYATNYLIDLEHAVIVDVEASRAIRQAEVGASRTMIDTARRSASALSPERLAADSAYGSAEKLAWLVDERGIEPHIPVIDKSQRTDGTFSRDDFTYDHASDGYAARPGSN